MEKLKQDIADIFEYSYDKRKGCKKLLKHEE